MKIKALIIPALFALAFFACDNFFHELIPPDGNRIESFSVPGQLSVEIGDSALTAYVSPNTDLTCLIPSIRVSYGATLLPVTREYVAYAFNDERTFGAAMEIYTSGSMTDKIVEMIRSNRTFNRPVMDMPIDFGYPVDFLVISGLGTIRQYKVRVEIDTGEGKFNSFKFDKFYNPEAVRSAVGVIDRETKTVTVDVSYPVENISSYQLTPSFETNGARVYLDGTEWRSGASVINFLKPPDSSDLNNPVYRSQTKTLTLKRAGFADTEWMLIVNFSEDPDTSRAITDFRFTRSLNPLISADYMAEIVNSGNTGTINVTVYCAGARPEELKASFVSPGTVTINGVTQISGYSAQNFSSSVQYVVTSRVGNNVRTYTVTVNLVSASDPLPQISYFSFSTSQNPLLVSNSTAMIDHNSRLILIEAAYDGDTAPVNLIPDFNATGTVTVNGVTQNSGVTKVNFSGPLIYTVSNSSNPTLKREYRVEVKFVRALSSVAEIETFSFYVADNPDLLADVHATVNQTTGAITATLLFETPGGNRTLVPRWSAQGRVETNGVPQTSGGMSRQFYTPQAYGVVSVDSGFRKDYTVTVKEVNSRIYVRQNATGRNDGTNWQNAYRSLNDAGNDINLFPDALTWFIRDGNIIFTDPANFILKEIWIAEGTYTSSSEIYLRSYTSLIGGFRGNEASKEARIAPASRRAVISGEQYGVLFIIDGSARSSSPFMSIEDLVFTGSTIGGLWISGGGSVIEPYPSTVIIKGVEFRDLVSNITGDGAISLLGVTDVIIENCSFSNTRALGNGTTNDGGAICSLSGSSITISNCSFTNVSAADYGGAIYISDGKATVTNCNFVNVSSGRNVGNAMCFNGCSSVTESGNTFIGVPSPAVSIY